MLFVNAGSLLLVTIVSRCTMKAFVNGSPQPSFSGEQVENLRLAELEGHRQESLQDRDELQQEIHELERRLFQKKDQLGYLNFRVDAMRETAQDLMDLKAVAVARMR